MSDFLGPRKTRDEWDLERRAMENRSTVFHSRNPTQVGGGTPGIADPQLSARSASLDHPEMSEQDREMLMRALLELQRQRRGDHRTTEVQPMAAFESSSINWGPYNEVNRYKSDRLQEFAAREQARKGQR